MPVEWLCTYVPWKPVGSSGRRGCGWSEMKTVTSDEMSFCPQVKAYPMDRRRQHANSETDTTAKKLDRNCVVEVTSAAHAVQQAGCAR